MLNVCNSECTDGLVSCNHVTDLVITCVGNHVFDITQLVIPDRYMITLVGQL